MGKRVALLVFSGTGNTAAVAGLLRDNLIGAGSTVDEFQLEDILLKRRAFSAAGYDLIGICYPSYGFNVPLIVTDFARTMDGPGHFGVFLLMTCAGPCYINDIAAYGLKRILTRRGFRVVYETVIVMPANVLIRYPDELVKQLYQAAEKRVRRMAGDLLSGTPGVRRDGVLAGLVRCAYAWCEGPMLRFLALDYRVLGTCTGCQTCVARCPMQNISIKNGKIRFGARCAGCYRCVYGCPQRAITARLYKAAILRDNYDLAGVAGDATPGNYVTKDTKGIFKTLYRYISES